MEKNNLKKKYSEQEINEAAKQAKNEYYKEWRKKPENKLKVKQYNQSYWAKKILQEVAEL